MGAAASPCRFTTACLMWRHSTSIVLPLRAPQVKLDPLLQLRGRPWGGDEQCRRGTSAQAEAARSLSWNWYARSLAAPRELSVFLADLACDYSIRATPGRGFVWRP